MCCTSYAETSRRQSSRKGDRPARHGRRCLRGALGAALAFAAANRMLDYAALVASLYAVGARARPSMVLLAYVIALGLALIPITPGGLGFVEAGLTTILVLAGVSADQAVLGTLLYRLISFWLPIPIGGSLGGLATASPPHAHRGDRP